MSKNKEWLQRLKYIRTYGPLKRATLNASSEKVLSTLTPEALEAAALNPDHSEAGRAAAREKLGGLRHETFDITAPGYIQPTDLARGAALFFGAGRRVRQWFGALALLFFIAAFVAVGVSLDAQEKAIAAAQAQGALSAEAAIALDEDFDWFEDSGATLAAAMPTSADVARGRLAQSAGYGVLGGAMLCLIVWLFATWMRAKPARITLLRKFNDRQIAKGIERVIDTHLRPFGHIVTLSDKHIRRSRFAWVSQLILAPSNPAGAAFYAVTLPLRAAYRVFDRSRFGPAIVASARDYRNVARRLRDKGGLNLEVALTAKEAFIVRTTDAWWKQVVALMLNSADVIVADLSWVTEGTVWELNEINARAFLGRTVFLAREDRVQDAYAAMDRFGVPHDKALFVYRALGDMVDQNGFRAAMVDAISASVEAKARAA